MSEMSRAARRAMRAKIHRITQANSGKVDASDYGPEEVLDAGIKTGMRPISRRAYKKGGKVVAVEGKDAAKHAGKKPRSGPKHLTVDALVNRNVKDANEDREGIKHVGGLKRGGRAGKAAGGAPDAGVPKERFSFSNPGGKSRVAQAFGFEKGGRTKKMGGGQLDVPRSGAAKIDTTSQAFKDAAAAAEAARKAAADRAQAKRDADKIGRAHV